MMRSFVLLPMFPRLMLAALVWLAFPPLAQAASKESRERAARKACLSGDYAKGVEILSDLFIDTRDPNIIYNQARCFEQNSRYEQAISRFREYLRKADNLSSEDKADAEKHIADCQALLSPQGEPERDKADAAQRKTEAIPVRAAVPDRAAPSPEATAATASPVVPAPREVDVSSTSPSRAYPGRGLRIAGVTCGVVGLASVGTAIYYYTRARSYSDKVSNQVTPNPSDESAGRSAQTMQWVFYGVGGAAIATGAVLYILGWKAADSAQPSASVAPMLAPGLAGISARGAF